MLTDPRRQQLDSIVRRMVDNKESDENIRVVVDDFSQKYANESVPQQQEKTVQPEFDNPIANVGTGVVKGALSTASGLVRGLANVIGKGVNKVTGSDRYVPITKQQFQQNAEEMGGFAQGFTAP